MNDHFDLIVIGSGPGGAALAQRLALINSARNLTAAAGPVHMRSSDTSQSGNSSPGDSQ